MSVQQILDTLGTEWDDKATTGSGFTRKRWLQSLSDVVSRHINNRVTASTSATNVNLNGAQQSTGVGTGPITPMRYGENLVHARVTFRINGAGVLYVYVMRTTGAIPANGAAPNGGDVIVGGDAFAGPPVAANQVQAGALSFFDSGLLQSQAYRYYLAVNGTNGLVATLSAASQVTVSEF